MAAQEGDGAGAARPPLPGVLARGAEGPHDRHAARAGGASRPAPPRARRSCTSACRRSASWPRNSSASIRPTRRSRCAPRCTTRWAASRPTSGPLRRCRACTRRASARAAASTAPTASAPTRSRSCACSARWRGARRRASPSRPPTGNSDGAAKTGRSSAPARARTLVTRQGGSERIAVLRDEMALSMERGCGIYRIGTEMQATCGKLAELQAALRERRRRGQVAASGTPNGCSRSSSASSSTSRRRWRIRRCARESRGAHQRLDGFDQRDDANYLKHTLAHYAGDGAAAHRLGRRRDHPLAAGDARLRRRGRAGEQDRKQARRPMAETRKVIEIEVLRYRPEQDAEPYVQTYQVPFTDDMSVLQGLQHIKDELDGSLTFRWSCRMAICGSCGMMIDGVPKLACRTFLRDYPPGHGARRAARAFPDRARPGGRRERLHRQARAHQAVDRPERAAHARRGRVPADPGAARADPAVQPLHQLHALLRRVPAVRARPELPRPRRDRAAASLQRRLARRRHAPSAWSSCNAEEGVWSCTAVGYCSEVCPKQVDPANAVNQNKTASAVDWFAAVPDAEGAGNERASPLRAADGRLVAARSRSSCATWRARRRRCSSSPTRWCCCVGVIRLAQGEAAYDAWLASAAQSLVARVHVVLLAVFVYHTWTWFQIMPKTMPPIRRPAAGGFRRPSSPRRDSLVAAVRERCAASPHAGRSRHEALERTDLLALFGAGGMLSALIGRDAGLHHRASRSRSACFCRAT